MFTRKERGAYKAYYLIRGMQHMRAPYMYGNFLGKAHDGEYLLRKHVRIISVE